MNVQDRINLFLKKEGFQPEAYHVCPVFDRCNCNLCPLDSNIELKTYSKLDQQRKCKCPKQIRKEVGIYFNLSNKGLTSREISGQKRWDSLSPEEKAIRQEKLKKISLFTRLSTKGYAITRKTPATPKFTQTTEIKTPNSSIVKPTIVAGEPK